MAYSTCYNARQRKRELCPRSWSEAWFSSFPDFQLELYRRNMNKTQKLLTALGLVSGVAFTAAFAAVPNNTLLSMQIGDPSTYDPAQAYDTASSEPIENMYESLVGYKGKSVSEIAPLLEGLMEMGDGCGCGCGLEAIDRVAEVLLNLGGFAFTSIGSEINKVNVASAQ